MKSDLVAFVLTALVAVGIFFSGDYYGKAHAVSGTRIVTEAIHDTVYRPPIHRRVAAQSVVTARDTVIADSMADTVLAQGLDSLRVKYAEAMLPKYATIPLDSVGTLHLVYLPPLDTFDVRLDRLPKIVDTVFVTRTRYVTKTNPAWMIAAVVSVGLLILKTVR